MSHEQIQVAGWLPWAALAPEAIYVHPWHLLVTCRACPSTWMSLPAAGSVPGQHCLESSPAGQM